jgi:hypothetical protein
MFVPVGGKSTAPASYLSLPALSALGRLIGEEGCRVIYQSLADVASQLVKPVIDSFLKILNGPSSTFDTGILQVQDPGSLIKQLGHVSAVLRLRMMIRSFAGEDALMRPENDPPLLRAMLEAGMKDLVENAKTVDLFASLLACPYWESFEYDVANDAVKDNSHLWARFFDVFVAVASASRSLITADIFYRQLFARCLTSINKGREALAGKGKKAGYPGLQLMILVDHIVSESQYADYSELENLVPYQLIRSLYTAQLSNITRD